jgi:cyanosortase A-associated protein
MNSVAQLSRQSLLGFLCVGALGALGYVLLNPISKASTPTVTKFDFPTTIALADAKQLDARALNPHTFKNGDVATGMSYRYQQNSQPIEIQIRYVTDGMANYPTTEVMLPIFTKVPATAATPATMKQQAGVGFYSLFTADKTAYFGTCINPRGISTVDAGQFHTNNQPNPLANGIPADRMLKWFLGRQTLRDSRCLWTILSTPIDSATADDTMKTLEKTGIKWIRWWQTHFPTA